MADEERWHRRHLSLRARTTIAATLVVAVAVAAGALLLLVVLARSLVSDVDQVAELRAADIAELAREGHLTSRLAADDDEAVQVVDGHGEVLASSANVTGRPRISTIRPTSSEPLRATLSHFARIPGQVRLLALGATTPAGDATVYVVTSLKQADATVTLVRSSLLVAVPVLLVLVALTTWITVGRALAPVEALRSEVADISRRQLSRRVPVPTTSDEISRLATTMNQMLDRLQRALEQQHRFVGDASHELQTPLAAMRAELEIALIHTDDTDWSATARELLADTARMERLVSDLLFIARVDDGVPLPPAAPVDLHELVLEETARLTTDELQIDTRGVNSAFVSGRRDDLARAVRNMLDNARRHADTTITVDLQTIDGTVALTIQDDGPGVPAAESQRVFERFARLDDARSRHHGGTGIGLAIVKDIAEQHHGTVSVNGAAPHGARFTLLLPAD